MRRARRLPRLVQEDLGPGEVASLEGEPPEDQVSLMDGVPRVPVLLPLGGGHDHPGRVVIGLVRLPGLEGRLGEMGEEIRLLVIVGRQRVGPLVFGEPLGRELLAFVAGFARHLQFFEMAQLLRPARDARLQVAPSAEQTFRLSAILEQRLSGGVPQNACVLGVGLDLLRPEGLGRFVGVAVDDGVKLSEGSAGDLGSRPVLDDPEDVPLPRDLRDLGPKALHRIVA